MTIENRKLIGRPYSLLLCMKQRKREYKLDFVFHSIGEGDQNRVVKTAALMPAELTDYPFEKICALLFYNQKSPKMGFTSSRLFDAFQCFGELFTSKQCTLPPPPHRREDCFNYYAYIFIKKDEQR